MQPSLNLNSKNDSKDLSIALDSMDLKLYSIDKINEIIDQVIAKNKKIIKTNEKKSFGMLMGSVMRKVRGKADPALVTKVLKKKIEEILEN